MRKGWPIQFCVDYRRLNNITRKDVDPVINGCLDTLSEEKGVQYHGLFERILSGDDGDQGSGEDRICGR